MRPSTGKVRRHCVFFAYRSGALAVFRSVRESATAQTTIDSTKKERIAVSDLREECGVFGVFAPEGAHVSSLTYYGLYALQHRG